MKKYLLLLPLFAAFYACDKVSNPVVKKTTVSGSNFITMSNAAVSNSRKTLLEDFTGQRCPNCPDAAALIKDNLEPTYGNNLVVLSVHQGALAKPFGASWPNDYRTTAGEEWGGSSGFGPFNEWPTGLINRKDYNNNGLKLTRTKWTSVMTLAQAEPFKLKLDLTTQYDPTVRALNISVKGTFKTAYTNKTNLVAVFAQDSIVGKQDVNGTEVEEYEFEHMLRGVINSTWGTEFTTAAVAAGDTVRWTQTGFPLPNETEKGSIGLPVNDKKVSVVVYVYDVSTREVIQVEKVKIR